MLQVKDKANESYRLLIDLCRHFKMDTSTTVLTDKTNKKSLLSQINY